MLSYMSKVKQNSQCNKVNAQFWNVMTIRIYIIHSKVDFLEKTAHFHVYHCNSPLYRGNIFYLRNDSSSIFINWSVQSLNCVHHQLQELTQTHILQVSDAIQPSHPLLSPSPPAFNLSQHQGIFQWVINWYM